MYEVAAALDELKNTIQTPFSSRNFKRGARRQAKGTQSCDVGEVEPLKGCVIRDIEEDRLRLNSWSWHADLLNLPRKRSASTLRVLSSLPVYVC